MQLKQTKTFAHITMALMLVFSVISPGLGGLVNIANAKAQTGPTVISSFPADNATGVSINVLPTLTFSDALDVATVKSGNVELREYAKSASDAKEVPSALVLSENDTVVTFQPASALQYNKQYYFYVDSGVKDKSGNTVSDKWLHADRDKHEFTTENAQVVLSLMGQTLSTPVSQDVEAGTANFNFAQIKLSASASNIEDVRVTALLVRDLVENGELSDVQNFKLYNGSILIDNVVVIQIDNLIKFTFNNPLIMQKGTDLGLSLYADVSSSALSGTHSLGLYSLTAEAESGNWVSITTSTTSGQSMTLFPYGGGGGVVSQQAELTLSKDNSFGDTTAVSGATGIKVASFVLQANEVENIKINNINIKLSQAGIFQNLMLKNGEDFISDVTPVSSEADSVSINLPNFILSASFSKIIDVYADIAPSVAGAETVTVGGVSALGLVSGVVPIFTSPTDASCQTVTVLNADDMQGGVSKQEYNALVALYNSTGGDNWTNHTNWLNPEAPVSEWYGVTVDSGKVISLQLSSNQLNGVLPPEIGNLINLTSLYLNYNNLSSAIPAEIGNLNNLKILDLHGNYNKLKKFPFPNGVLSLISLEKLDLSSNGISSVPSEIINLVNLTDLQLFGNRLNEFPTEVLGLTNLESLNVAYNFYISSVPENINILSNLRYLDIRSNNITVLPDSILDLKKLEGLWVRDNKLDFGSLEKIKTLSSLWQFDHSWHNYSPQQDFSVEPSDFDFKVGDTLVLDVITGGTANKYQWFKDGVAISEISRTSNYIKENITEDNFGLYTCQITNDIVTGLNLISKPIHVYVYTVKAPGFTSVEPVDPININSTTLYKVIIDPGENSTSTDTTFAVRLQIGSEFAPCLAEKCLVYMQEDGGWGDNPVWFTYEQWGGSLGKVMKDLVGDTQYNISVAAMNADGVASEFGGAMWFGLNWTANPAPELIVPTNITTSSVMLNWSSGGGTEHEFIIERLDLGEDPSFTQLATIPVSRTATEYSYVISDLTPDTTYNEGSYRVAAQDSVYSSFANSASFKTLAIIAPDTIAPIITLVGGDVTINQGATYTDAGATATDNVDGDITAKIVTVNPVNTAVAGAYTVTYNVSDAAGNAATPVSRTVTVVVPAPAPAPAPVITNNSNGGGSGPIVIRQFVIPTGAILKAGLAEGTARTASNHVTLSLYGGPNAARMAISNYADFPFASQEPYVTTKDWKLSDGDGPKIVYIKFFDTNGYASPVLTVLVDSIGMALTPAATLVAMVLGEKITKLDTLIDTLKQNQVGPKVNELQEELKKIGFFHPTFKTTNFYGPLTAAAVKKYQASKQPATSIGQVLGEKITKLDTLIDTLKQNQVGPKVNELQEELKKLGFFHPTFKTTNFYGPLTAAAVKKYLASK